MELRRFAVAFGLSLTVAAGAGAAGARAQSDPAFVTAGLGYFNVLQEDDGALDLRLEYRHGEKFWFFKPWVGVEATGDGAFFAAAGILADVNLGRRFVLTPSFGAGLFAQGDGKDLGHVVEFRSQIEVAYRFDDNSRLGVAFGHISNASLDDRNPGVEILGLYYSLPLAR